MSSRMVVASPFELLVPTAGLASTPANAGLVAAIAPPTPWWMTRRAAIAAASAAALLVLVVVVLLAGSRDEAAAPHAEGAVTAGAAVPPGHDVPELVDLVVHVSPPGAAVTIDGATVQTLPFHARVAKDALVHHVAASADGFEPKVVDVTFVSDTSVDISLERRPAAPTIRYLAAPPAPHASKHSSTSAPASSPPTSEPASAPPGPSRIDVAPTGGHAPLRPITTSNPYGNQ
jgi:hypothetical protein